MYACIYICMPSLFFQSRVFTLLVVASDGCYCYWWLVDKKRSNQSYSFHYIKEEKSFCQTKKYVNRFLRCYTIWVVVVTAFFSLFFVNQKNTPKIIVVSSILCLTKWLVSIMKTSVTVCLTFVHHSLRSGISQWGKQWNISERTTTIR